MIQSAVTVSLVSEARGGPFVFWDDLAAALRHAQQLGFDAVEIFPPHASAVDARQLGPRLEQHHLKLAAVGTGAGWLLRKLSLTSPDPGLRDQAKVFIREVVDVAGGFGAPAIIGSMQGRHGDGVDRSTALAYLGEALAELGNHARQYGVPLLYEPLNRYETNLINTIQGGVDLLQNHAADNVQLLADLFHMNIEEVNLADAIRAAAGHVGHVHLADSNRQAAGSGHTDFLPIAQALRDIGYLGYASAEVFALPDSYRAAQLTIEAFRKFFVAQC
jgi:sugar phosphate isomerase/epimerase